MRTGPGQLDGYGVKDSKTVFLRTEDIGSEANFFYEQKKSTL